MNKMSAAGGCFAAGAMMMYFLDPNRGKRRRTLVRDKATSTWNDFSTFLDKAQRDASNRAHGAMAGIKGAFKDPPGGKEALAQRVKSKIGRVLSHPHAVSADAENGKIVLRGPLFHHEVDRLLRAVKSVPGVREIVNQLEMYEHAGHISSLQGGTRRESRSEFNQQNWTPSLRAAAGGLGSAMVAYSLLNHSRLRRVCGLAGSAMLARAISNRELGEIVGVGGMPRAIEIDKTVNICTPVGEVFALWSDYERFPRFMAHVKEVRDLGQGKSHWVAEGPGGVSFSWDAEMTDRVENKLLAWQSVPGSPIETRGTVRFDQNPDGSTRVSIRLCYKPIAGVIGHYVASLFGANPKQEIDEDMVRLKSLIEYGRTRANGHRITREDLAATHS